MAENQHIKQRARGPGKPFVKGDPRINRAKAGPGRPPEDWTAWCRGQFHSPEARERLAKLMWKTDRFGRPNFVLTKLMEYAFGKPVQVVEQEVQWDLSRLSREELETLARLLDRITAPAGVPAGPGQTPH